MTWNLIELPRQSLFATFHQCSILVKLPVVLFVHPWNMHSCMIKWLKQFNICSWTHAYPGWSPRANQGWSALFQRFHKFQRWSALFQNGLRKPKLISAVSELFSAGFLWISVVQRWIKTNWEIDENASCKLEQVLGSRKTCSFGVYQLWKKNSGKNSVKNSNFCFSAVQSWISAFQRFSGNEQRWNRPESFLNQSWSALNVSETSTRVCI